MFRRVGVYWYLAPTYAHAKKIIWDGIDSQGVGYMERFPDELIDKKNEQDLMIKTTNGSIFQLIGTDKIKDAIVGPNPVGCVFSEFSLMAPVAYELIRPIVRENGGWLAFNFTPRGKNHAYKLFNMAKNNPAWWSSFLTIKDTKRDSFGEDGSTVVTLEDIEEDRREGMEEELIQQEYYCSFEGYLVGSYYGKLLQDLARTERITKVPWEPDLRVDTWWDIGVSDATSIWFTQTFRNECRVIDYYENSGEGLPHYQSILSSKPYAYGIHMAPHDIKVREWGAGEGRLEIAARLGIHFQVSPKKAIADGIEASRKILPLCWFDEEKCSQGLNALGSYHKQWNDGRQQFNNTPVHDWSSNAADAFRTLAMNWRGKGYSRDHKEIVVETGGELF